MHQLNRPQMHLGGENCMKLKEECSTDAQNQKFSEWRLFKKMPAPLPPSPHKIDKNISVTNALRHLRVALYKGNAEILGMGIQQFAGCSGRARVQDRDQPIAHFD